MAIMLFLIVSVAIVVAFSALVAPEVLIANINFHAKQSYFLGEAGIEDATYRIMEGMQYSAVETLTLNNSSVTTTITDLGSDQKEIQASGDVGDAIRNIKVNLTTTATGNSFFYGAQVGYLGVDMNQSSRIIGSVYSNGSIIGENSATITGDAWVAGGVGSVPNQEQITQTDDLNLKDVTERLDGAQKFIPSITADVRVLSLYMKKVGSPGPVNVKIVADDSGIPSTSASDVYASKSFDHDAVGTSYSWVDIALNSQQPLFADQIYWIVLDTGPVNPTRYYVLGGADDTTYTRGTFLYSANWSVASPIWTPPTQGPRDLTFKMFLGEVDTGLEGMTVGEAGLGDAHAHSIEDSTIAHDAYYQTISGSTVGGADFPGSPDPSPIDLPLSQTEIEGFKGEGDAGGVCDDNGLPPATPPYCDDQGDYKLDHTDTGTIGPIVIPGNLELLQTSELTMTGTVHVQGDFLCSNSSQIKLDPSFGSASGVIVVDGTISIEESCSLSGSGNPSSYLMVLTTSPQLNAPAALTLRNSGSGAIFYASEGAALVEQSSNSKAVIAQQLKIRNSATVTYETGLANVNFSNGPSGGWEIITWREVE